MLSKRTLKQCRVFQALSEADLDRIAELAHSTAHEAGQVIFEQGMPATDLYVIEKGKVALQMHLSAPGESRARRITVDVATANDAFGWSGGVEQCVFSMTAVCLEPTTIASIDAAKLGELLRHDTCIGYQVLNELLDVVGARLDETRQVLVSERLSPLKSAR